MSDSGQMRTNSKKHQIHFTTLPTGGCQTVVDFSAGPTTLLRDPSCGVDGKCLDRYSNRHPPQSRTCRGGGEGLWLENRAHRITQRHFNSVRFVLSALGDSSPLLLSTTQSPRATQCRISSYPHERPVQSVQVQLVQVSDQGKRSWSKGEVVGNFTFPHSIGKEQEDK